MINQHPHLSARKLWVLFCAAAQPAVVLLMVGCQSNGPTELSLAEQSKQVRSGIRESILVEARPLSDSDLEAVRGLQGLHTLLLDHPGNRFSAAGLSKLNGLDNLIHLRIRGHGVDDEAVSHITKLKSLRILNVPQAEITDAGLANLAELPNLEQLRLGSSKVTQAGIEAIAALPRLKRLHLIDIPVGDAGLKALAGMKQLESLYLDGAEVTDAGVDELFRLRPELHVHFEQQHHDRDPSSHAHDP
jgi:Leucine-rich repeat (LRR) protein